LHHRVEQVYFLLVELRKEQSLKILVSGCYLNGKVMMLKVSALYFALSTRLNQLKLMLESRLGSIGVTLN
jgi:hypothetical protein